jgi:hypothetical protein
MLNTRWAALVAAFVLSACGGGGGGGEKPPPPPGPISQAEALRLAGQAVMDVTTVAWALSFDVQNTLVTAPGEAVRTASCPQGGRTLVTRPGTGLLRIEHEACRFGDLTFGGLVEADGAMVKVDSTGTQWSGTVRMNNFSAITTGSSPRSQTLSVTATGAGTVSTRAQPLTLQLSGLVARRTPSALGRDATLTSAALRVQRIPGALDDLYALEGCVALSASGLAAELCIDAGSRIGLVQNVADEQLTGRLRWNAGTPAGFDARLRISPPAGGTDRNVLRIELDLDNNGSFEASVSLDRSTGIGLRL